MPDTRFADALSQQKHLISAKQVGDDADDVPRLPAQFLEPPVLFGVALPRRMEQRCGGAICRRPIPASNA